MSTETQPLAPDTVQGEPKWWQRRPQGKPGPPELGAAGFPELEKRLTNPRLERSLFLPELFAGAAGFQQPPASAPSSCVPDSHTGHLRLWDSGKLPGTSPAHADPAAWRGKGWKTTLCSTRQASSPPTLLWAANWLPLLCSAGDVFPGRGEFGDCLASCLSLQAQGSEQRGRHPL